MMKITRSIVGRGTRTLLSVGLCTLLALGLGGCGQKGPLVLPSAIAK
ncbi:MAG: LPS translocon maturation chaperone LptM [Burkholderiaceae bacterium]|jgi:predicted small lipoprotein YifL